MFLTALFIFQLCNYLHVDELIPDRFFFFSFLFLIVVLCVYNRSPSRFLFLLPLECGSSLMTIFQYSFPVTVSKVQCCVPFTLLCFFSFSSLLPLPWSLRCRKLYHTAHSSPTSPISSVFLTLTNLLKFPCNLSLWIPSPDFFPGYFRAS